MTAQKTKSLAAVNADPYALRVEKKVSEVDPELMTSKEIEEKRYRTEDDFIYGAISGN